jgi:integrase
VDLFRQFCAGRSSNDLIFTRGGLAYGHCNQDRPMRMACERAKLTGISFHSLRHTWASLAVMAGMPLPVVARNLGHANTAMVETHYGHLCPNYITDQIRDKAPRFGVTATNVVPLVA